LLAPAPVIPPDASLLDIGSGGGFPGIPLKVLMPSLSVTLIDASRKKVSFLKHVIRTLKLENIEAQYVRAEDLVRDRTFANNYDVIISRALSSMDTFVLMALPLLAKEGIIIVMKGKTSKEEIESEYSLIKKMSGISEGNENNITLNLIKYTLPYLQSERSVLIFKRIR
jgi:16S rRNA (guanine527-N7)-methyltransferase